MKWMRPKRILSNPDKGLFHLPRDGECNYDIHYYQTLCRREIKHINWEIVEDPPEDQCCPLCIVLSKLKGV